MSNKETQKSTQAISESLSTKIQEHSTSEITDPNTHVELTTVESSVASLLQSYDEKVANTNKNATSFMDMYNECMKFGDTNEMLRKNLVQIQLLFQKAYEGFWQTKKEIDNILGGMQTGTVEQVRAYLEESEKMMKVSMEYMKQIEKLSRLVIAMTKEYRECAMSRRSAVHISTVQKMLIAFKAVIHDMIHDETTLVGIEDALTDVMRELFPPSAESDF